jgi:hypothetical protein
MLGNVCLVTFDQGYAWLVRFASLLRIKVMLGNVCLVIYGRGYAWLVRCASLLTTKVLLGNVCLVVYDEESFYWESNLQIQKKN